MENFDILCIRYEKESMKVAKQMNTIDIDFPFIPPQIDYLCQLAEMVEAHPDSQKESNNRRIMSLHTLAEQATLSPNERDSRFRWL